MPSSEPNLPAVRLIIMLEGVAMGPVRELRLLGFPSRKEGLERAPDAFAGLFMGGALGKMLVKLA